jgi:uncharacterized protein GlcG (DUF336 family)
MKKLAIALLLASSLAGTARADEDVLVNFKMMTPETALKLAQVTLRDCRDRGYQVAVVVVDRFGNMQVLLRDRFAGVHTSETARRKAWTAVSFRTDTTEMAEQTQAGKEAAGVRFVDQALMVGGGIVIRAAGAIVGGIGVSGAPGGAADDECARAGIEAIQGDLDF